MHRFTLITLLFVMFVVSACADAGPSSEATPEIVPPIQPELTPESTEEVSPVEWTRYVESGSTAPGWVFQHPTGWEVVNLDGRNVFLYSASGAGERLFVNGLQPGELVFQISLNPAANVDETATAHLTALSEGLREAALGDIEPVTIAGLDGVHRRGVIEAFGLSFVVSSRPFFGGQFIDLIAYSRTDEFESNWPLMSAVIETVRYVLPTE